MNVLMFSMERALLGEKAFGDAVERHRKYAEVVLRGGKKIDRLDIVVFSKKGYKGEKLSEKVFAYPTNSATRFTYFFDAVRMGKKIYQDNPYLLVIGDLFTSLAAWWLKKKFGCKFLTHFHGDFWGNIKALEGKWHNWFVLLLSKFLARRADGIRVVSKGIRNKLVKAGVDKKKIEVINTPTSIHLVNNPDKARVEGIRGEVGSKKIVLFIGRLEKVKNIFLLVEAFKEVLKEYKNVVLMMIGDGSLRGALEKQLQNDKLERKIKLVGSLNVKDWKEYIAASQMLILPSSSESFGNVLALAGAAGLPVVASRTTGARDIVKDKETGFLVGVNNKRQLKEKILMLLKDEQMAREMGEKARRYCRDKFDPEKTTKKIVKFWWEIVAR